MTWLAADIRANSDKNILVFVHEPVDQQALGTTPYYTLNDKGGLIDLLAAHPKQSFVFSGHIHGLTGVTHWKGITSVHVMNGARPNYGVGVTVNGDQISVTRAGATTEFDQHPMNQVDTVGGQRIVRVAEDGVNSGNTRGPKMAPVGPENGVMPTSGSLMLKAQSMTWYDPRFISEQLIKIQPGMKFSFDMYLLDVVGGNDAVTVQPDWYMKNGSIPPLVVDQNGIQLSRRSKDGLYFVYNNDVPKLGGRATGQWYHREFDLSALAGNYVDGVYLTGAATIVNVGTIYVDNVRFTWPAVGNALPSVTLTSPTEGASFSAPATIPLSAAASDSDGTVASVSYYLGATLIGTVTSAPYSASWSGVAAGSYTLTATATDNVGATTTSPPIHVIVGSTSGTASAVFVGTDTTTKGTWKGVYGSEGYMLANNATSLPSYATVTQPGVPAWTWTSSTTDVRALQTAAAADRMASTWYGGNFTVDVNLTDSRTHRLAMYVLDWDALGRSETIQIVDAVTGAPLDTRIVTAFSGGQYWVWTVSGHVTIRVALTGGPNAVYSALLFDPVGSSGNAPSSAVFVGTDTTTQGTWKGVYGSDGYMLANNATSLPSYAAVTPPGVPAWTWTSSTNDVRALQKAAAADRVAATWYGGNFTVDVNLTDSRTHRLAMYVLDGDALGRSETIQIVDAVTGAPLDTRSLAAFSGGQYWVWTVSGHVTIRVTLTGGANAVYSALFFDLVGSSGNAPSSAVFVGTDTTTQGTWKGMYGSDGFMLANNATSLPSYAAVTPPGVPAWTWTSSTSDVRALQKAAASDRVAATWYGGNFTVDVNLTDSRTHRLALYVSDWDALGRSETIQIVDAVTGAPLDTRSATAFSGGQYWVWTVSGHVTIRVALTGGPNAVYSGLFFGS